MTDTVFLYLLISIVWNIPIPSLSSSTPFYEQRDIIIEESHEQVHSSIPQTHESGYRLLDELLSHFDRSDDLHVAFLDGRTLMLIGETHGKDGSDTIKDLLKIRCQDRELAYFMEGVPRSKTVEARLSAERGSLPPFKTPCYGLEDPGILLTSLMGLRGTSRDLTLEPEQLRWAVFHTLLAYPRTEWVEFNTHVIGARAELSQDTFEDVYLVMLGLIQGLFETTTYLEESQAVSMLLTHPPWLTTTTGGEKGFQCLAALLSNHLYFLDEREATRIFETNCLELEKWTQSYSDLYWNCSPSFMELFTGEKSLVRHRRNQVWIDNLATTLDEIPEELPIVIVVGRAHIPGLLELLSERAAEYTKELGIVE